VAGESPVLTASTREPEGLAGLRGLLGDGLTVALLGSSGVGKSSIVNRLSGRDLLATAPVRESDSRGRHTTTHRELVPLPEGGALIDTPGLRELQLWAGTDSVDQAFGEIAALGEACRYRDCRHTSEDGCAVLEAAARGQVDPDRLTAWRKLHAEALWHETREDPLAALARKRKWKIIHKAVRAWQRQNE